MNWLQRYRLAHIVDHSVWIPSAISMVAALVLVRMVHEIDVAAGLKSRIDPDTMRTLLVTLAGSMFTIVVFICSALLIAIQLASVQLTPRIIAFVFRSPALKLSLSLFVFVFTFSLATLVRIDQDVPLLSAHISTWGFVFSLAMFLFVVDQVGKNLRPSGVLRWVATLGRGVIEDVYPNPYIDAAESTSVLPNATFEGLGRTVLSVREGSVLAFDIHGLRALAERSDCVMELVPQVGDYVAIGDPLFRIHGARIGFTDDQLCQSVALGPERTLQQDPTFAFRIMVDIASKALSPAINDPTTAVLAIDHIHHLLRKVGGRCLDDERIRDASGKIRLVYRTPDWQEFVQLAVTEIRHFGGDSIQVTRRLRAMLKNLIQSVPPRRAGLLQKELRLLNRSAERFFVDPEDRALAEISDLQGVGGRPENGNASETVRQL